MDKKVKKLKEWLGGVCIHNPPGSKKVLISQLENLLRWFKPSRPVQK